MRCAPWVVFVLISFTSQIGHAEPTPLTPVPPGPDVISPLKQGAKAPFDGQLFDAPTALRWANYLQQCHLRLRLDVEEQERVDGLEIDLLRKKLELERLQYTQVTGDLQKKLFEVQAAVDNPPWYRSVGFGVVLGVVGSVVLMGITLALVNAGP
jgi:hypothetical protein